MIRLRRALSQRRPVADVTPADPSPARGWLALPPGRSEDVSVKPLAYLPIYEELLAPLRAGPMAMLELGVWKGDSLAMWRDAFPQATIVGVDLAPPAVDLGPRVHIVTGDQTDRELLSRLAAEHAPGGFDVIIDDASHLGEVSARSLQALYADHLRPGGLYIIEDWGTGYVVDWPDGMALERPVATPELDWASDAASSPEASGRRLPSHDAGMVGLVKRLVDHTARTTLSVHQPDRLAAPLTIEWLRVHDGLAILKKPA